MLKYACEIVSTGAFLRLYIDPFGPISLTQIDSAAKILTTAFIAKMEAKNVSMENVKMEQLNLRVFALLAGPVFFATKT